VRIPLDYYRIIGLPLQATAEQIEQAYQDRLRQTPHSEYSQGTLAARKELLDLAYDVLSDPEQRSAYDANYLLSNYEVSEEEVALPQIQSEQEEALAVTPHTPMLEVDTPQQLLGALLILYELGEYQRVRHLAEWVLADPGHAFGSSSENQELSSAMHGDLILTFALACWELGRELWRQEQYEAAGEAVERGYQELVDWEVFPELRQDMAGELEKLCPYRIFELVSERDRVQEDSVPKAIALLEGMFEQRGGIDGEIPDDSGLNIDEFLHFVQQIRTYLTAPEQEELFAKEAQRPSAVGMYLAACAGIARGFAYWEPHYILKAQRFLKQLQQNHQQPGSTTDLYLEQAICTLLLGETETAINQIQKTQETESLAQIQAYASQAGDSPDFLLGLCNYAQEWLESVLFPKFLDLADQSASLKDYFASESVQQTLESFQEKETLQEETWEQEEPTASVTHASETSSQQEHELQQWHLPVSAPTSNQSSEPAVNQPSPVSRPRRRKSRSNKRLRFSSKASRIMALMAVSGVGLGAIALFVFGVYRGVNALWANLFDQQSKSVQQESDPLAIELNNPVVEIPSPDSGSQEQQDSAESDATMPLNRDRAEQVIRTWLDSKAKAFGPDHQIEALNQILTGSLLSSRKSQAQQYEQNNWYQYFSHSLSIESFSYPAENVTTEAQITATVREVAKFYRNGNLTEARSYDSTLKVRYDIVRENKTWRIEGIEVLNQ
jgi:hypothetical protein